MKIEIEKAGNGYILREIKTGRMFFKEGMSEMVVPESNPEICSSFNELMQRLMEIFGERLSIQ